LSKKTRPRAGIKHLGPDMDKLLVYKGHVITAQSRGGRVLQVIRRVGIGEVATSPTISAAKKWVDDYQAGGFVPFESRAEKHPVKRSSIPRGAKYPKKSIGTFFNTSGLMIVADPCYDVNNIKDVPMTRETQRHGMWVGTAVKGEWRAYVQTVAHAAGAAALWARKTNSRGESWDVFDLHVDSGLMAISDYTPDFGGEKWYDMILRIKDKSVLTTFNWKGSSKTGVVVGTAYGDGTYPLLVNRNKKGEVVEIGIKFVEDELLNEKKTRPVKSQKAKKARKAMKQQISAQGSDTYSFKDKQRQMTLEGKGKKPRGQTTLLPTKKKQTFDGSRDEERAAARKAMDKAASKKGQSKLIRS